MASSYPLNGEVVCAERVARWRPLLNWALVIPLYLWLMVLGFGAGVVSLAGWFVILFTGGLPGRFGDYVVAVVRYQWRGGGWFVVLWHRARGCRVFGRLRG